VSTPTIPARYADLYQLAAHTFIPPLIDLAITAESRTTEHKLCS